MKSSKSLVSRYYELKCGYAPTVMYLKRSGQRDNDQCGWCGRVTHGSISSVIARSGRTSSENCGNQSGGKAGRCKHLQISELFSLEMCDQVVMEFLAATEVGKFPRR